MAATTTTIVWSATKDFGVAAWIGSVEVVSKLVLYYAHERIWQLAPRGTVRRAPSPGPTPQPVETPGS